MESNKAEEDMGMKPEGEEEAMSAAGEDAENSSGVAEGISQLGILFILPTWSSCIRGKIEIVSDVVALIIS